MKLPAAFGLWALLLSSSVANANPIPDKTFQDANRLARDVGRGGSDEQRKAFIRTLGWYGYGILEARTRNLIDKNFDRFAPLLAASQAPPYRIDHQLQELFQARAKGAARLAMLKSLRPWLTAKLTQAPRDGGMQMMGNDEHVHARILQERIRAAEALADLGDRESLPLFRKLGGSRDLEIDLRFWNPPFPPRWYLDQARQRLANPNAGSLFEANRSGRVRLLRSFREIEVMEIGHSSMDSSVRAETKRLRRGLWGTVWTHIARSRVTKGRLGSIRGRGLTIRFRDGYVAVFDVGGDQGKLQLTSNGRMDDWYYGQPVENPELHALLKEELEIK